MDDLMNRDRLVLRYVYANPNRLMDVSSLHSKNSTDMLEVLRSLNTSLPSMELVGKAAGTLYSKQQEYWDAVFRDKSEVSEKVFNDTISEVIVLVEEDVPPELDYEQLKLITLDIVGELKTKAFLTRIIKQISIRDGINVERKGFTKKVIQPLLRSGLLFKLDPLSRQSAYVTEKVLKDESQSLDEEALTDIDMKAYPILPILNDDIGGGLCKGDIFLYNAITNSGKSYFYMSVAKKALDLGLKVKYIDLEMTIGRISKVISHIVGGRVDTSVFGSSNRVNGDSQFSYQYMGSGIMTNSFLQELSNKYDVVIIDYAKWERFEDGIKASKEGSAKGAKIIEGLTRVATPDRDQDRDGCIFVTGTQIINVSAQARTPYWNVRGGDSWIEGASHSWSCYKKEDEGASFIATIRIDKARGGDVCVGRDYQFSVDKRTTAYTPYPAEYN